MKHHASRALLPGLLVVLLCVAGLGAVDPSDGVSVLLLLCEPYGANTNLWFNSFEKAGWNVTIAGLRDTIGPCSSVSDPVQVDVTLDRLTSLAGFDALVVSTTPGTFASLPFPAEDLRTSALALDWIRQANAAGLALYAGCSGLLVLGDAGILTGRTVAYHPDLSQECKGYGATCKQGGQSLLPLVDGNLITGTSGRYFAQEIVETISWTLDGLASGAPRTGAVGATSLAVQAFPIAAAGPVTQGWAIGGSRSDIARAVCPLGDGFVIVGSTFSSPGGTSDLLAIRCDPAGTVLWARAVGGPGTDAGEGVCAAADGGVVAVGRTTSMSAGVDDLWLVKLDGDGNLLWSKTFGDAGPDAGFDVISTADGGYAACGRTSAGIGTSSDLFLVKVDRDGRELWTAKAGGVRLERGHGLAEGSDGTLFVAGGTTSSGRGNYDAWLAAFSPTGTRLWEKTYGLTAFDVAEDLVLRQDGSFFLTGTGDVDAVDGNNVLSIRFDNTGTFVAAQRIDNQYGFDYGEGAVELDDGGILICGACTSPSTMLNDAWLIRLAPDASIVWKEKLGDPGDNEWASAICRLASGQLVVVGHTLSAGAGAHDVLAFFVDPAWSP